MQCKIKIMYFEIYLYKYKAISIQYQYQSRSRVSILFKHISSQEKILKNYWDQYGKVAKGFGSWRYFSNQRAFPFEENPRHMVEPIRWAELAQERQIQRQTQTKRQTQTQKKMFRAFPFQLLTHDEAPPMEGIGWMFPEDWFAPASWVKGVLTH